MFLVGGWWLGLGLAIAIAIGSQALHPSPRWEIRAYYRIWPEANYICICIRLYMYLVFEARPASWVVVVVVGLECIFEMYLAFGQIHPRNWLY